MCLSYSISFAFVLVKQHKQLIGYRKCFQIIFCQLSNCFSTTADAQVQTHSLIEMEMTWQIELVIKCFSY